MTKYFLNSGATMKNPEKGVKFFSEIFKDLRPQPKLLICAFAQPREDWEERFKRGQEFFNQNFNSDIKPILTLAMPENFQQQVAEADVIYIHGGDDHLIQYWLKQFDLPKIWEGKRVAASSAGSNALVKHFWTCDWRKTMDGLGIIPVKFLPHFKSSYGEDDPRGPVDWDKAKSELVNYGDTDLPIFTPQEGDYEVFEV